MGAFALRHDFRRDLAADVEDPGEKQGSSSTMLGSSCEDLKLMFSECCVKQASFSFHISLLSFLSYKPILFVFQNNSSSSDAPEGNKLSDVVKGTARPHTRFEEKVKATPAPSSTVAATPAAAAASAPAATPVSMADSTPTTQMTNTNTATPLTAAAVVSAVASSPVAKETEVSASPSPASYSNTPASATAVEPSAHPSKSVCVWAFSSSRLMFW